MIARAAGHVLRSHRALGCLGLIAAVLLVTACNTGTYPVDVFPEMHYQPSHRPLEPARLSPPAGSVPTTGAAPTLTYVQAEGLTSPVSRSPEEIGRARELYRVNCATCHGATGDGRGPMARYYVQSPSASVPPSDLNAPRVRSRTDGQLWWIVRYGLGNMPGYDRLLVDSDIWRTILFIREVQGQ